MITAALLALVLPSSADDCAVLEAAVATPWHTSRVWGMDVSSEIPEQRFVAFRPARDALPASCSRTDGMTNSAEIDACEQRAIDHFEALSPEERFADGHRAGAALAVWAVGTDLPVWRNDDGSIELPEGLEASFTNVVNLHQNWGCRSSNWQYTESDYYNGIAADLYNRVVEAPGYYLETTRPGYSSDGRWAVTAYSDVYIFEEPHPWEGGGPVASTASKGYRIFELQRGEWRETSRMVRQRQLIMVPESPPERIAD